MSSSDENKSLVSTDKENYVKTEQAKEKDPIFDLLKENKLEEATKYIEDDKLKGCIDCVDEHGTTPLQYAAFRGWHSLCQLLISKGADVNAKTHDQGYSALMFAAISNHKHVVSLLLENEADADYTNMIGRTASQMAAFVNSNDCVDLINNYISKNSLEYYTKINSVTEKEPKLPKGDCVTELHKLLVNSSNYSPIRILKAIKMSKNNVLMLNIERIIKTLDAFCTKSFKKDECDCPNDVLAFKLHFYKYNFEYILNTKKALQKKLESESKSSDVINDEKIFDICFKQLISQEDVTVKLGVEDQKVMCRVFEEKFLRESIRQFPYIECALVRQLVTILSKAQIGAHPSALYVITSCLNGQRLNEGLDALEEDSTNKKTKLECATCHQKSYEAKWCTHCKKVAYCDQICQRIHWPIHKKENF